MTEIGYVFLLLSVVFAAYSVVGSGFGKYLGIPELVKSARRAVYFTFVALLISTGILVAAFVLHDFSFRYVAGHSSNAMAPWLTWVAFYAGNEGSLLFIATVFNGLVVIAITRCAREAQEALPYTTAVLMAVVLFFVLVMALLANPFAELEIVPLDGQGINPLLTHPGMFFHPPMLMTGLIAVAIPFAFGIGYLLSGQTQDEWVEAARNWGLVVWTILTIGLLLGSWWAYTILGWGGYWAWDPVENAGLLPWLPLTAFIHSIIVQRRRGIFRMWNLALIITAWTLAMYGMFMNRGGSIPSVHSFAQSTLGWVFLGFLAMNLLASVIIFFLRSRDFRKPSSFESVLSREAAFLANNALFLLIALVVLWGVVFPLISEVFRGVTVTVGKPFYDVMAGPLFLSLILLMGIAPLLPWRKATPKYVLRGLIFPILVAGNVGFMCLLLGLRDLLPIISFSLSSFVAAGILREWVKGVISLRSRGVNIFVAFPKLIFSNRPRYGGYIAHIGIIVLALSVTGSSFYSIQKDIPLAVGERSTVEHYEIEYVSHQTEVKIDRIEQRARLNIYANAEQIDTLYPGYAFYPAHAMAATRAGIRSTVVEDL
ncbi:heme lyase CcmF/NrfE family subunit, partial [SAR202 cluster bacterium AD-802-E10_MRT_200m]|nr:heme lyase CcmF/NrfE family subunit [SAR202 cluster bacterium AD-802-E10_MRT_200m]